MRLHLIDINKWLVAAWREKFALFPEVEVVEGDIIEVARNAVVSPANSFGYMSGGIDLVYRDYFGIQVERDVQEAIERRPEGLLPVGAGLVVRTGDARISHLVVAPTMVIPGPVETVNCALAMGAALSVASEHSIQDLYCPGLATGTGMVFPREAANAMAAAYEQWKRKNATSGEAL